MEPKSRPSFSEILDFLTGIIEQVDIDEPSITQEEFENAYQEAEKDYYQTDQQ